MNKIAYLDLKNETLIDIRSQEDFQKAHAKGSLNFNPKNFSKFALDFIEVSEPIVFVVDEGADDERELVAKEAEEMGFQKIIGYLSFDDIPEDQIETTPTISVEDFLSLDDDYTLLDLRNPAELTRPAPEKNLVNVPIENLKNTTDSLDRKKVVYTLCGSGNRATSAASYLKQNGYQPVVVEGGMKAVEEYRNK